MSVDLKLDIGCTGKSRQSARFRQTACQSYCLTVIIYLSGGNSGDFFELLQLFLH